MIKIGALHCCALPVLLNYFFKKKMFVYNFQLFFIIYVNVKFNLKYYTFHGHENTHDNLFLNIHVGG
jgi:hypothetical protein